MGSGYAFSFLIVLFGKSPFPKGAWKAHLIAKLHLIEGQAVHMMLNGNAFHKRTCDEAVFHDADAVFKLGKPAIVDIDGHVDGQRCEPIGSKAILLLHALPHGLHRAEGYAARMESRPQTAAVTTQCR